MLLKSWGEDAPALQFLNAKKSFLMLRAQWLRVREKAAQLTKIAQW